MSLLSVTVKKARYVGIQAQQYNSYVTLKLQHVKSTTVTVKGPNPCWEQDFLFETNDVNAGLLIEVWSKGMIWDRALGYYYIPLRDIQYSNEEGSGQWFMLDAEIIMRDGEVVGTKNPTGDSLLLDCRFELPFGRYDPPSGWKSLLAPDSEMRSGPRSLGDEDNTDWLPLARQNLPDHWSGGDAENSMEDALQRKLERLNRTIFGQDEQTRWPLYYSGYSEDSDYTSDLNYPVGQHPNSSASHFKRAAQHMRTPDTSLETSRENSSETDDGPVQGHLQASYRLQINHSNQQGMGTQNYKTQQEYRNYNETDGEPLYYNSRPRNYKEYSSQKWYYPPDDYEDATEDPNTPNNKKGGRRPSLERQTTLYDDQYYSDEQYFDGTDKQQSQSNTAQNYGEYYDQDYEYQNESYGEEEEDKQWDSGGYYYSDDYAISSTNNYQNVLNEKRSSKTLPATGYSNSIQDQTYYTPTRDNTYENESIAYNPTLSAATKRRLLKQQHQSSDEYSSTMDWPSDDNGTAWQSAEDYNYYDDYNNTTTKAIPPPVMTPSHRPKKRMLPQIRATSRNRASVVSLPQTPNRKLPKPPTGANRKRVSAPVSRTTSADNDRNGLYDTGAFNENYNYAYASNDNLQNDKFSDYPTETRTSVNYQESYESAVPYINDYQNKENYPEPVQDYKPETKNYQNTRNLNNSYNKPQRDQDYLSDYYPEDSLESSFENDATQGVNQKMFLERRANSPLTQQNTDSLESRDDELRDESFETAVDSICSSITVQKQSTEYSSFDTSFDYKPDSIKQQQYFQQQQQQFQQQQYQQQLQQQQIQQQQQQSQQQNQQQSTSVLGNIFGSLTRSPSHYQQQQDQQQKQGQRTRDQSNLLSNPALAAMNVTKGIFSSITNAVNNTVQNINKQQQQQQQQKTQQQTENHVQRIQVTKRGSLKQQETVDSLASYNSRQNSFESQIHEPPIPEEPPNYENEKEEEEEYYNQQEDYYEYDEKDYYERDERDEENYNQKSVDEGVELNHINQRNDSENMSISKRNNFRHQDTVESEGKRPEVKSRSYLRQQDSVDSGAEEMMLSNDHRGSPTVTDRYDDTRTGSIEPLETNHVDISRKRGSGHDNSLIEPYHPNWSGSEVQKSYSGSPPVMQKQQSVDLEGIEEEEVPEKSPPLPTLQEEEKTAAEPEQEETKKSVVPERRKMTAKERWHRAYNIVVQRLNVSFTFLYFYIVTDTAMLQEIFLSVYFAVVGI